LGENIDFLVFCFFFFQCFEEKIDFDFAVVSPCVDGEGDPGAAHPPPGAGEGQRVVQGLLQPLHHLPQNQDAQ